MGGILRSAIQGVAGGIGLASESITVYKKSSKDKKNAVRGVEISNPDEQQSPLGQSTHEPPSCQRSPAESTCQEQIPHSKSEDHEQYQEERGNTEEQWDLDEAQEELTPPPYDSAQVQSRDVSQIVSSFVASHPPPSYTPQVGGGPARLTHPVILPQRRPKARSRGFVRAYAPVLESCGIDQAMFLEFLDTFEKASQASPWLNTINLAGIGTMFIPGVAGFLTGAAIQLSVSVAMEVQARTRTNTFLDNINATFFRPRGLYCLIMTYDPESDSPSSTVDIASAITSSAASKTSTMGRMKHKLKSSSGTTYSELDVLEPAPLIFPALDLQKMENEEVGKKGGGFKSGKRFVDDYYDRRAQAKFSGENPDSLLSQQVPTSTTFTSRYADPNHPVNSGSLISLVTGGYINPPARSRGGLNRGGGLGGIIGAAVQARTGKGGEMMGREQARMVMRNEERGKERESRQVGLGGLPTLGGPQGIKRMFKK
ncbi:MAG: hypothetical protein Q9195_007100, partial [Heterodermia aff. obscurata]